MKGALPAMPDRAGGLRPEPRAASQSIRTHIASAELTIAASNLRRYPFESATMAEAARLASNALDSIADSFGSHPEEGEGSHRQSDDQGAARACPPQAIWVEFSNCGKHIRKWSIVPFEGGAMFVDSING